MTGRAALIVALVCCYADQINAMHSGQIAFDCGASGQVAPSLHERLEAS